MTVVNIYEAKTQLSRLLRRVRAGEEIVIADAGRPVARLVPVSAEVLPRELGGDEDDVWIAEDFDAALPAEVEDAFWSGSRRGAETRARRERGSR